MKIAKSHKELLKLLQEKEANGEHIYDFARLMEGANEVKCSEFADAIIKNLK